MTSSSTQSSVFQLPNPQDQPEYWQHLRHVLDTILTKWFNFHRFICRFPDCTNPVSDHSVDFCTDCWSKLRPARDSQLSALCTQCCLNRATKEVQKAGLFTAAKTRYLWCEGCFRSRQSEAIAFWKPEEQPYGFLGNWYPSPFSLDQLRFKTVEQFMMFCKALIGHAPEMAYQIYQTDDPKECKHLAGPENVKQLDVKYWDSISHLVVSLGLYLKFLHNPELLQQLISTQGKRLIEASPYDKIWGVGWSANDPECYDTSKWKSAGSDKPGPNLLGRCLMGVRTTFIKGRQPQLQSQLKWVAQMFGLPRQSLTERLSLETKFQSSLEQMTKEKVELTRQLRRLETQLMDLTDRRTQIGVQLNEKFHTNCQQVDSEFDILD